MSAEIAAKAKRQRNYWISLSRMNGLSSTGFCGSGGSGSPAFLRVLAGPRGGGIGRVEIRFAAAGSRRAEAPAIRATEIMRR